jgi:hypothetical protein
LRRGQAALVSPMRGFQAAESAPLQDMPEVSFVARELFPTHDLQVHSEDGPPLSLDIELHFTLYISSFYEVSVLCRSRHGLS